MIINLQAGFRAESSYCVEVRVIWRNISRMVLIELMLRFYVNWSEEALHDSSNHDCSLRRCKKKCTVNSVFVKIIEEKLNTVHHDAKRQTEPLRTVKQCVLPQGRIWHRYCWREKNSTFYLCEWSCPIVIWKIRNNRLTDMLDRLWWRYYLENALTLKRHQYVYSRNGEIKRKLNVQWKEATFGCHANIQSI